MNYLSWNKLIASHFFRPEKAGQSVYLYVTEQLIAQLGQEEGVGVADFIRAAKNEYPGKNICQQALKSKEYWEYRSRYRTDYPHYIGYLALFALAAGIEGDCAPHAYYPRLRELLKEKSSKGQYPDFDKIKILWQELEQWSHEDKAGQYGLFNCVTVGKHKHVGLPLAQTLLTEEERCKLPHIFEAASFDPYEPPLEETLVSQLIKYGRDYLRSRTIERLQDIEDQQGIRQAILEIIIIELESWDGTTEDDSSSGKKVFGTLRLCLKFDRSASNLTFRLRCSTPHEFPEDELLLKTERVDVVNTLSCFEEIEGWSSLLKDESSGKVFDASMLDWREGLQLRSPDGKWLFRLPKSPVRVFVRGEIQGLQGMVESSYLPVENSFGLACHEDCLEVIKTWGKSSCQEFQEIEIAEGLPNRWHFFKATEASSDELLQKKNIGLSFPTTVKIKPLDGIRLGRRNVFFNFAPPKVVVLGANPNVQVYCNGYPLHEKEGIYELPTKEYLNQFNIEAKEGEKVVKRCCLSLSQKLDWKFLQPIQTFDRFYQPLCNNVKVNVAGTLTAGVEIPEFNFNTFLPLQGKQRITFIGRKPGQISNWPSETLPKDWMPVWAIAKGRRSTVSFCGSSIAESTPIICQCNDRRKLKKWQEILWHDRKKIEPPRRGDLKILWNQFQQEAKRV